MEDKNNKNIEKELTFDELLILNKKTYKVYIDDLGYVIVKRPTAKDQAVAVASVDIAKNPIQWRNLIVSLCLVKPKLGLEQVGELPDHIIRKVSEYIYSLDETLPLSKKGTDTDFLETLQKIRDLLP